MIYNYLHDVLLQLQLRKLICAIMDGNNFSSGWVRHAETSSALLRALTAAKYDMLSDLAYQCRIEYLTYQYFLPDKNPHMLQATEEQRLCKFLST